MTYEERLEKAHEELESKGIWKSNYNPPLFDLARKCGYKTAPPHYRSFLSNFTRQALFFFVAWGCAMYLLVWRGSDIDASFLLSVSSTVALLFAFIMSVYYKFSAQYHHLSTWESFK
ncbi:DUF6404 family protein [Psychromonas sp. Urea-02u-13]|uniref:DUF6404 family protein n=1 Tax=Psychromonas sp. Urea-02u-13 TaxID=2058326 RepID=UPI000C34D92E|nr:DUF6404 family protein [Psychromonas sp. Urea-02u-13]PKG37693.1 hypothetical protein CXF74_17585 [Psychromonas sp. Urea-02u-13]